MDYKIGSFSFRTKKEYEKALQELKYIEAIKKNYDIDNINIQAQILKKIQDKSISFETQIGVAFTNYIKQKYSNTSALHEQSKGNFHKKNKLKSNFSLRNKSILLLIPLFLIVIYLMVNNYKNSSILRIEEYTDGYYVCGTSNYDIKELVIPSKIRGKKIKGIMGSFIADCYELERVVLKKGITNIGRKAFVLNENIKEIVIPETINYIGDMAFFYCGGLKVIDLPDSCDYIGESAFANCYSLESIKIPSGVKSIENFCFAGTRNLKKIVLPNTITYIGKQAFENCNSLKEITIPMNVEKIDRAAFHRCNMNSMIFESSKTIISDDIFIDGNTRNLTIYAPSGSTAEEFAYAKGINFISTTKPFDGNIAFRDDKLVDDKTDILEENETENVAEEYDVLLDDEHTDIANIDFLFLISEWVWDNPDEQTVVDSLGSPITDSYFDEATGEHYKGLKTRFNNISGILYADYSTEEYSSFEWISDYEISDKELLDVFFDNNCELILESDELNIKCYILREPLGLGIETNNNEGYYNISFYRHSIN